MMTTSTTSTSRRMTLRHRALAPSRLRALALAVALGATLAPAPLVAQAGALGAVGAPRDPKVKLPWDTYYDHAGIGEIVRKLAAAHPNYVKAGSIGKSHGGKDIWLLTVTDFRTGDADKKPAYYIDGNIHSNEIQGSEFALYTAWYLAEMAGTVPAVDSILRERTLYIVPTINPDARDHFLHEPNTASSPRTGLAPRDTDGDGAIDEDGYDDLDGNGHITQMRRRNPNGRLIESPIDPRILIPAPPDRKGEWEMLGLEGLDNDGDGEVNEDAIGGYDPNRNWPWRWQPQYVQGGADYYPGSLPETRAVMQFVLAHPNIAAAQSFHNSGGMILRGPGVPQDEYKPADVRVFDQLGRVGEQVLPGYRYMIVWKDLYTAWGGELDWLYGARGIITFSNELFTPFLYFDKPPTNEPGDNVQYQFDRLMLLGEGFIPWTKYDHPVYGEVEIGGMKKSFGRATPGPLLRIEAHRNLAFTLYQVRNLPQVTVDSVWSRSLPGGLTEVTAIVGNPRLIPTHTQQDVDNRITRPDWVTIEGGEAIAAYLVTDPRMGEAVEQKGTPRRVEVANIPGMGTVTVRWIVRGGGPYTVTVDSEKGGTARRTTRD
jgi:hypothetical protein